MRLRLAVTGITPLRWDAAATASERQPLVAGTRWQNSAVRTTKPDCSLDVKRSGWLDREGGSASAAPPLSAQRWIGSDAGGVLPVALANHLPERQAGGPGGAAHRCHARLRVPDRGAVAEEVSVGCCASFSAQSLTTFRPIDISPPRNPMDPAPQLKTCGRHRCRSRQRSGWRESHRRGATTRAAPAPAPPGRTRRRTGRSGCGCAAPAGRTPAGRRR